MNSKLLKGIRHEEIDTRAARLPVLLIGPSQAVIERFSVSLWGRIRARLPELKAVEAELIEAEEDGVYRFYHDSFKIFYLQEPVKSG